MGRFIVDPERSQVWIDGSSSVHPIHATATGLSGWIDLLTPDDTTGGGAAMGGEIRIAVERLESGNAFVDRETRRRIDARRHPEIVGTVTAAERTDETRIAVTGDLSFRGETRSVRGEITVVTEGERIVIDGTQTFDVREWGLRPPRLALLRVHPDVRVRIHVAADPSR